jgi:hypothetical protein
MRHLQRFTNDFGFLSIARKKTELSSATKLEIRTWPTWLFLKKPDIRVHRACIPVIHSAESKNGKVIGASYRLKILLAICAS